MYLQISGKMETIKEIIWNGLVKHWVILQCMIGMTLFKLTKTLVSYFSSFLFRYKVGVDDFVKNGGRGLLSSYNNSIQNCVEFVFPEHDWLSWKFQKLPSGYLLLFLISSRFE